MQHFQGGGEPPYGAPTPTMATSTFLLPLSPATVPAPAAASSVVLPTQPPLAVTAPEEFPPAASSWRAAVNFHDDDMMALDVVGGSSGGGAGGSSNRWPREETLALIRIRSEMDAAFRNATLKAPVWEELSRRFAELGYQRSGKKCKEKFENVDKYYKRTKERRVGQQDGKSYRFFSQLEALHATMTSHVVTASQQHHQQALTVQDPRLLEMTWMEPAVERLGNSTDEDSSMQTLSYLSMSSNEDSDKDSVKENDEEQVSNYRDGIERFKRGGDNEEGSSGRWMMALFEGMIRQVTEKQDAMQQVFMETLDKWEIERAEREEEWRWKETARMKREQELLSQERAAMASRDAALIAFLNHVGGEQFLKLFPPRTATMHAAVSAIPPPFYDVEAAMVPVPPPKSNVEEGCTGGEGSGSMPPSRWPKEEVQALIDMRMEKEKYNDTGTKGMFWEEIAVGMQRIGYNRSAKRCKEKWENINKYYKKVKDSNKRRPEDSKTCPYFHQLDAIYRKKHLANIGTDASGVAAASSTNLAIITVPEQEILSQHEIDGKRSNDGNVQLAMPDNITTIDKMIEVTRAGTNITVETDSEDMGGNYNNDGHDDDKIQYKIQFQKPNVSGSGSTIVPTITVSATTSSTPTPNLMSNTSFLAVQ
ncbi:hypothetical protein GUJ93_ZPchr0002g26034 [Zizania palustris]|uniref:Myb-like domain-containing protein n=1 Tax=Zizania palustris TaxID=103762 RepID=A0A8J5VWJ0_ZIZPA|nr:hypothetical protein GUJ93_ZPchr0002g26034 [Zizania palustris]